MAHFRDTPSHGYYYASAGELQRMPAIARRAEYEEDCEWSLMIVGLPELANQTDVFGKDPAKTIEDARRVCRDYYPDIFEQLTGEQATPETSTKRFKDKFYQDNKDRYIGISASGDWKKGVPVGYVEVIATIGGERDPRKGKRFFVKAEDYRFRGSCGYLFPVDPICSECEKSGNGIFIATMRGNSDGESWHLCEKHTAEHMTNLLLNW